MPNFIFAVYRHNNLQHEVNKVKVNKSRKQILKFSFDPKNIFVFLSKMGQIKKQRQTIILDHRGWRCR